MTTNEQWYSQGVDDNNKSFKDFMAQITAPKRVKSEAREEHYDQD